ncbi:MAG: A/G-specific adenine glycosylase [Nocardioidaceae bacterium]
MPDATLHTPVLDWYAAHARELPWRRPSTPAWGVLVSEVMLQQTPVARVLPVYDAWMRTWPTPARLAAVPPGDAVRAWGRLGYPRRALRLHAAARAITDQHDGVVPSEPAELRALPGVGEYTASAVAAFAYRQRHAVLDTNVRRVLARTLAGTAHPPGWVTVAERQAAEEVLPDDDATAARWSVAVMELGATVCTARAPDCTACPVAGECAWAAAGFPAYDGPARRRQGYAGTDRQCRGRLLAVLRESDGPVHRSTLQRVWEEPSQQARALEGLVADGLVEPLGADLLRLPV